ncbi:MAG: coenzyme F420-0:L-glutamate ligase, partial [Rhodospirillales bacterium]|nr:coenzyme F420-0:L-glutamate ligase [Rhodospirillales bacterium]
TDKDPRLVELILSESSEVLRHRPNLVIVLHKLGLVMANAGIDASNIQPGDKGERVLLLPRDPDASAARLRSELRWRTGAEVGIVINDSVGRAWRRGIVGTAIGAAGLAALVDLRGQDDLFGRPLAVTQIAPADEVAAAASLLQGQADEGRPVVLVRGLALAAEGESAADLVRPASEDLFR